MAEEKILEAAGEKPLTVAEALSAINVESMILEAAGEKTEADGEKSPGDVPKKPKIEKVEKKFPSYEAEMTYHMMSCSEKLTFLEARSMMQKALPHEIMRNAMKA